MNNKTLKVGTVVYLEPNSIVYGFVPEGLTNYTQEEIIDKNNIVLNRVTIDKTYIYPTLNKEKLKELIYKKIKNKLIEDFINIDYSNLAEYINNLNYSNIEYEYYRFEPGEYVITEITNITPNKYFFTGSNTNNIFITLKRLYKGKIVEDEREIYLINLGLYLIDKDKFIINIDDTEIKKPKYLYYLLKDKIVGKKELIFIK